VGDNAIRDLVEKIKAENLEADFVYIANGNGPAPDVYPKIGEEVPEFALDDLDGKKVSAADLRGKKTLVTFWSTTCPHCANMMEELKVWEKERTDGDPELIVFSDGEPEAHRNLALGSTLVLDAGYKTAEKFGMFGTPSAVLVNEDGRIVSETAVGAPNIWALIGKRKLNES
jgi:peroxiredoxin